MPRQKKNERPATLAIPQTIEQANDFLRRYGHEQREAERIRSGLKEETERLKAAAVPQANAHDTLAEELKKGLQVFADVNRAALTESEKLKTVEVPAGKFGWRKLPASIVIEDEEAVLARVKAQELLQFVRVTETLSKQAMLKEPDLALSLEGVTICQDEERFFVEPAKLVVKLPQLQAPAARRSVAANARKRA